MNDQHIAILDAGRRRQRGVCAAGVSDATAASIADCHLTKAILHGHVANDRSHAPASRSQDGRYVSKITYPIAGLAPVHAAFGAPEAVQSAKFVPTGWIVPVPCELLPTSAQNAFDCAVVNALAHLFAEHEYEAPLKAASQLDEPPAGQ